MRFEPSLVSTLLILLFLFGTAGRVKAQEDPIYRELALRKRLETVRLEEAQLLQVDRALQPLKWPKVAMIAGFGVTGVFTLASIGVSSQRSSDQDGKTELAPSETISRVIGATVFASMATGFTGLGILLYRVRNRPHRAQALELKQEHREIQREMNELVRRQNRRWSLAPAFSHADSRVGLQLRGRF